MSKVKFVLDRNGVRELLKSAEVSEACHSVASQVYGNVSLLPGYAIEPRNYPERAGWAVFAAEYPAIQDNLSNNSLLKALGK